MKNKKIRLLILLLIVGFYLIFAIEIRPNVYSQPNKLILKKVLGCLPNFIAVIAATNFIQLFNNDDKIFKPILYSGIAILLYEVTGGFGRKSGIGITFDYLDIIATLIGVVIAYIIELRLKRN